MSPHVFFKRQASRYEEQNNLNKMKLYDEILKEIKLWH